MEQPEGVVTDKSKVCRMKKSLYGLKQSPRCWNKKFTNSILAHKFKQSHADPCLFIRHGKNGIEILAIYVDDCILIGHPSSIQEMKKLLQSQFKMTDLGEMKYFLGIEVNRTSSSVTISQKKYITEMLEKFGMADCRKTDTPAVPTVKTFESPPLDSSVPYRQAIGALNYLSTCTRPDISYAVHFVARSMQNPTENDWVNVKRIFRYLKYSANFGITYSKSKEGKILGYSDASYAPESTDRKSTTGYVFLKNGGAISWKSKRQPIISLSSMEAEYIALTTTCKEGMWLRQLEHDVTGIKSPMKILEDNQSTIKTASNHIHNDRSKHIDVRYHWTREKVELQQITLEYCQTNNMAADMFTKAVGKQLLERHNTCIGLSGTCN
jgi:hypothetical protein